MLLFGIRDPQTIIMFAIIIFFAFAYHEWAHAVVADRLGDPTPRSAGRLTFNPFAHVQLAGYVMVLMFGFGGAYTPVSPTRLRKPWRQSHAIVSIAGPLANLAMASLFAVPLRLAISGTIPYPNEAVLEFLQLGVNINVFLMIFNLIPIPPLDGFSILQGLLPANLAHQLDPLRQYGFLIFLVVFLMLPRAGIDLFSNFLFPAIRFVQSLLIG